MQENELIITLHTHTERYFMLSKFMILILIQQFNVSHFHSFSGFNTAFNNLFKIKG